MTLILSPAHLAIVREILQAHLPPASRIWAFGSRAGGRVKPYSDLDLLIDAGRRLTSAESVDLADAFTESDLPWKVDVIDRHTTSASFLQVIEPHLIPVLPIGQPAA
jgi:type I restriction enzyme S subunit